MLANSKLTPHTQFIAGGPDPLLASETILAGAPFGPQAMMQIFDDFIGDSTFDGTSYNWLQTFYRWTVGHVGNSITANNTTSVAGHVGLLDINCRGNGGGDWGELTLNNCFYGCAGLQMKISQRLNTAADATRTIYLGIGMAVGGVGDPNVGLFFRAVGVGNWFACSRNGGAVTATDAGVATDTNYHTFAIVVNAAGTSVGFYIDGVLKATIATNLPSASATVSIYFHYEVDGVPQHAFWDYMWALQTGLTR
jgi:hypothetical protein